MKWLLIFFFGIVLTGGAILCKDHTEQSSCLNDCACGICDAKCVNHKECPGVIDTEHYSSRCKRASLFVQVVAFVIFGFVAGLAILALGYIIKCASCRFRKPRMSTVYDRL